MLPPGSNHETYEPAPMDMEKISSSEVYFTLGTLDFELTWLDRLQTANPAMKIIKTNVGIEMITGHDHETGTGHPSADPHTWLSPSCMKIQAVTICRTLCGIDSANSELYRSNLEKFNKTADSVDTRIKTLLNTSKGKTLLIFHPALGYFTRDYQLNQLTIEQEGKEPSTSYISQLIDKSKVLGIKAIYISKEFDTRNAEAIANEIGAKVIVFDPMRADWPENLVELATRIANN